MTALLFVHHNSSHKAKKVHQREGIKYFQLCFNNKSNLLCTSTEPQQRSDGRPWPQSVQMNAECFRETVNCILNTAYARAQGVILTSTLSQVCCWWVDLLCWGFTGASQKSMGDFCLTVLSSHNSVPLDISAQSLNSCLAIQQRDDMCWLCHTLSFLIKQHPGDRNNLCVLTLVNPWACWTLSAWKDLLEENQGLSMTWLL